MPWPTSIPAPTSTASASRSRSSARWTARPRSSPHSPLHEEIRIISQKAWPGFWACPFGLKGGWSAAETSRATETLRSGRFFWHFWHGATEGVDQLVESLADLRRRLHRHGADLGDSERPGEFE